MTATIIQDRLRNYSASSKADEFNALKEIYQEIALSGLARTDFFKSAAFQGGTALRICHQLRRFSEDLDFVLLAPCESFSWLHFLQAIESEFNSFGVALQTKERAEAKGAVKSAILKHDSFVRILELKYDRLPSDEQKISIKLEIDTNPPEGSSFETTYLVYPYPFSILVQDLPSLFASKCHALLCRKYEKGRDWFDFLWYISKGVPVNYSLLRSALQQAGPYQGMNISLEKEWFLGELERRITVADWKAARRDVENFLRSEDRRFVENWNSEVFKQQLERLNIL
ncbi:MAG: nucleotidyl transferase AbiEii/AbiGii toxin family protein [Chlamydiia bacterium]